MHKQIETGQRKLTLPGIEHVKRFFSVASGKGGVGKTTVAVNLALALSKAGSRVGLLDADIYGPSVPVMLGLQGEPIGAGGMLVPRERFGLKIMSVGFLIEEDQPVIWRGPMVSKMITEFLGKVRWGEIDYLVVDLPPGTGDPSTYCPCPASRGRRHRHHPPVGGPGGRAQGGVHVPQARQADSRGR